MFFAYLRSHIKSIMMFCLFTLVFSVVFLLYSLPLEPVAYAALLCICTGLCFFASGYFRFIRRHRLLKQLLVTITLNDEGLPVTEDLLEKDYQELVRAVHDDKLRIASEADAARAELIEYYTLWAHQIKNPIAAISLLLQSNVESLGSAGSAEASAGNPSEASVGNSAGNSDANPADNSTDNSIDNAESNPAGVFRELSMELFKIEQYVGMVLQYLRLDSSSTDYLLKTYELDEIVKQAVRKYSRMFIGKRIGLDLKDLNCKVLTDEKWLAFVIEQVLSNALKYTREGTISIYMEQKSKDITGGKDTAGGKDAADGDDIAAGKTLVIEDTGIGIQAEDLPRVFDKGFTGYNGRADKKSTGIGLYLCRRILKKLSHTMSIESEVGSGTRVKIGLDSIKLGRE